MFGIWFVALCIAIIFRVSDLKNVKGGNIILAVASTLALVLFFVWFFGIVLGDFLGLALGLALGLYIAFAKFDSVKAVKVRFFDRRR